MAQLVVSTRAGGVDELGRSAEVLELTGEALERDDARGFEVGRVGEEVRDRVMGGWLDACAEARRPPAIDAVGLCFLEDDTVFDRDAALGGDADEVLETRGPAAVAALDAELPPVARLEGMLLPLAHDPILGVDRDEERRVLRGV